MMENKITSLEWKLSEDSFAAGCLLVTRYLNMSSRGLSDGECSSFNSNTTQSSKERKAYGHAMRICLGQEQC